MDIKNILCPVDFSDPSGRVAAYATKMAKTFGAKVTFLYVSPALTRYGLFQVSPEEIDRFAKSVLSGAEDNMKQFIEEHEAGAEVKGRVEMGYAADVILEISGQEDFDLIVMGTHGRRGLDRAIFGSVAEKVVKKSEVPVLTVRPKRK